MVVAKGGVGLVTGLGMSLCFYSAARLRELRPGAAGTLLPGVAALLWMGVGQWVSASALVRALVRWSALGLAPEDR